MARIFALVLLGAFSQGLAVLDDEILAYLGGEDAGAGQSEIDKTELQKSGQDIALQLTSLTGEAVGGHKLSAQTKQNLNTASRVFKTLGAIATSTAFVGGPISLGLGFFFALTGTALAAVGGGSATTPELLKGGMATRLQAFFPDQTVTNDLTWQMYAHQEQQLQNIAARLDGLMKLNVVAYVKEETTFMSVTSDLHAEMMQYLADDNFEGLDKFLCRVMPFYLVEKAKIFNDAFEWKDRLSWIETEEGAARAVLRHGKLISARFQAFSLAFVYFSTASCAEVGAASQRASIEEVSSKLGDVQGGGGLAAGLSKVLQPGASVKDMQGAFREVARLLKDLDEFMSKEHRSFAFKIMLNSPKEAVSTCAQDSDRADGCPCSAQGAQLGHVECQSKRCNDQFNICESALCGLWVKDFADARPAVISATMPDHKTFSTVYTRHGPSLPAGGTLEDLKKTLREKLKAGSALSKGCCLHACMKTVHSDLWDNYENNKTAGCWWTNNLGKTMKSREVRKASSFFSSDTIVDVEVDVEKYLGELWDGPAIKKMEDVANAEFKITYGSYGSSAQAFVKESQGLLRTEMATWFTSVRDKCIAEFCWDT